MAPENSTPEVVVKEKIKFSPKELFGVTWKLAIIVAVVVLMLALVNMLTRGAIIENNNKKVSDALSNLFPESQHTQLATPDGVDKNSVLSVYEMSIEGKKQGYCIEVSANGFSSDDVKLMVGVTTQDFSVVGIEVVSSSETPGIGAAVLAKNGEYLSKFKNVSRLSVEDIDTISGATITSKAVKTAVITAVEAAALAEGGAVNG